MIAALLAMTLQTAQAVPTPDAPTYRGQGQMRTFDMICNRVFPDEARIDAAMAKLPMARPLTAEEVRTYLKGDPGHGWIMPAGTSRMIVTLEAPPFHSCAVRMTNTDGVIDEPMWRQLLAAAQARAGGGFTVIPPRTIPLGDVRSLVSGVQKQAADGSAESIYLFRTTPVDPAKAPGYGVEIRMVRQLVAPKG